MGCGAGKPQIVEQEARGKNTLAVALALVLVLVLVWEAFSTKIEGFWDWW